MLCVCDPVTKRIPTPEMTEKCEGPAEAIISIRGTALDISRVYYFSKNSLAKTDQICREYLRRHFIVFKNTKSKRSLRLLFKELN